jgi:hypothetical protein
LSILLDTPLAAFPGFLLTPLAFAFVEVLVIFREAPLGIALALGLVFLYLPDLFCQFRLSFAGLLVCLGIEFVLDFELLFGHRLVTCRQIPVMGPATGIYPLVDGLGGGRREGE